VQTALGTADRRNQTASLLLLLVLLSATALRLWGIAWGLPSATHYFSYHPDESTVLVTAVLGIDFLHGRFLPGFYNYGSLQLYLINWATTSAYFADAVKEFPPPLTDYADWARLYLIGRLIAVIQSVGTVWLTYAIGARLWGRRAGLMGATFLAVTPLHVQHSHWLVVDVPTTFWITLAIYWSVRIVQALGEPGKRRAGYAVWAGVAVGFASATKYNAILALVPAVYAIWAASRTAAPLRHALHFQLSTFNFQLLALFTGCAAAFLLGCPGSVLDSAAFLRDFRYEAVHVSSQPGETYADTGSGFIYEIATNLRGGLGCSLLLFTLVSLIYAVVRRQRGDGLLAAFAIPYYILISIAAVRYARYSMPLLPLLALWSGRLAAELTRTTDVTNRRVAFTAAAIVVASTLGVTVSLIGPMTRTDPRDRALAWLTDHGLSNAPAGFATVPWFQTVPLNPGFSCFEPVLMGANGASRGWLSLPTTPPDWRARYLYPFHGPDPDWDASILDDDRPPIVLLSEFDYRDALRLGRPKVKRYLAKLRAQYRVGAEFGGYGNKLDTSGPPYDMLYANPATWVFVRK
jgi:hypothetical protein